MKKTKIEVEVLSQGCSSTIIQMPDRHFPGVVIQGDSLNILLDSLMSALERLNGKTDRETFLYILKQTEAIEEYLRDYETTFKEQGIPLPYERDTNRTTTKYADYWKR